MLKMSYVHRPALQPLEYRTLIQLFDIHAKSYPEREAFVIYNQAGQRSYYSFKQMQQQSLSLAASFLRIGWKRGERVVLMIPSRVEFLLSYMALLRIGVNVQLLPSSGKPIDEVIAIIDKCQGLVFCESASASFNNQLQGYLKTRFEDQSKVVVIDTDVENVKEDVEYSKYTDLLKTGEQLDVDEVVKVQEKVQFDDPAVVMFTSGSTGAPKGVQHTHYTLVNGAMLVAKFEFDIEIDRQQNGNSECRLFSDRPFYWSGCLGIGINTVLSIGCTLVVTPPIKSVKECDINFFLKLLQNEKCTNGFLMPYVLVDVINHPEIGIYDLSCLRAVRTGGQPLPTIILNKLASILPNCKIFKSYGLTEVLQTVATHQVVRLQTPNEDDLGMDGVPPIEIKIIDENQSLLPVGHVGEICVRSPTSFLEYVDNKEETSKVISNTGWVHTGDIGVINQKGRLTVRGRNGDMIKRATVKIFPTEVEKVLSKYPDLKDVTVVGIPEVRLYEELCACVIPKHGRAWQFNVSEFDEWMRHQWSVDEQGLSLKPEHVLLMEDFPKKKTGKIDRKALRTIAAKKLGVELQYD